MNKFEREQHVFNRFRREQLGELIEYLKDEMEEVQGEIINHVRAEEFTKAAMSAGELDTYRMLVKRAERNLDARGKEE